MSTSGGKALCSTCGDDFWGKWFAWVDKRGEEQCDYFLMNCLYVY